MPQRDSSSCCHRCVAAHSESCVPAFPAAPAGISVDSGSDISKDAADVILLEKSLTVLTHGVTRGRLTHGNTIKARQGLLSWVVAMWSNGSELNITAAAPTRQHN